MSSSVLTLVLLVDLLAPGGRAEPCGVGLRFPAWGAQEGGSPLWSVPASDPERRAARAALPEPRPDPECATHRHELAGALEFPIGVTAGAGGAEGDGEDPICVEDSRCSPVPTERSGVIPALKFFKGMVTLPVRCPAPEVETEPVPGGRGEASPGFAEPLFRPPR